MAASLALCLSSIPFTDPVGTVTVGMIDGKFILNPTAEQREKSATAFDSLCNKRKNYDDRSWCK